MKNHSGIIFSVTICLLFFGMPVHLSAGTQDVVFWNKMQDFDGSKLTSEVEPDLNLTGTNWGFLPAMFDNGWDNNTESSYAYANSTDLIESIREGAVAFWWVPDDDGDTEFTTPFGSARKTTVFFSNGATNYPQNNTYGLEFWYAHYMSPASFYIQLWKQDNAGNFYQIQMHAGDHAHTGAWQAGDRVHVAFAWHNEPVILGQYIAALWVDGVLAYGWAQPDIGTLEDWRTTNPVTPFSSIMRTGDSIFSYSMDEQLRGPIDNIVFWNYAKSDYSDRFIESPLALPPTADAGPNQSIHAGDTVILDGSGSYDDTTPTESLLFDWSFTAIPAGSTTTLNNPGTVNPSFLADQPGTYDVSLVVTDEDGLSSDPSQVSVSSLNTPPNADAGADRASYVGNLLTLDGTGSSDPDNDPLTYSWMLATSPAGSTAQLYEENTATPSITPDLPGSYEAKLTVNDGFIDSSPDSVTLTIITAEDYTQQQVAETINLVAELPPTSVSTSGNQQALTNFLNQAIEQLQKDEIEESISKIVMAIERCDGCALRGSPDLQGSGLRKDYVTDCDDQVMIYPLLINALEALQ